MGSRNVFVVISRTIFCVFNYFMTCIGISLEYAIPLPHPKRVCEGLGGVTLPDVPALCLGQTSTLVREHFLPFLRPHCPHLLRPNTGWWR